MGIRLIKSAVLLAAGLPLEGDALLLWRAAERLSVDPLFGFNMDQSLQPTHFQLIAFTMLSSETLASAIDKISKYQRFQQPIKILEIVINNLIRNAFHHTHKGSVKVSGTAQYVEVEDTSIGFTYTKNFTPHSVQHESGLGLGLNIVQRICQLKGWQILIESTLGEGTLIRINFSNT
jgi:signal transduction histidine kinase